MRKGTGSTRGRNDGLSKLHCRRYLCHLTLLRGPHVRGQLSRHQNQENTCSEHPEHMRDNDCTVHRILYCKYSHTVPYLAAAHADLLGCIASCSAYALRHPVKTWGYGNIAISGNLLCRSPLFFCLLILAPLIAGQREQGERVITDGCL